MTAYSNSRLENVNVCPTFGVVNAQKRYSGYARSMALECGETMHQVFAAVRTWQLAELQGMPKHATATGYRIFGEARWRRMIKSCDSHTKDRRSEEWAQHLAFEVLHTSGYEDDPMDQTRTIANMELASIIYIEEQALKHENWSIYVENEGKPDCMVGIEQAFDIVVQYPTDWGDTKDIRFIGTLDGLLLNMNKGGRLTVDDNKTTNRMDKGWLAKWDIANQITGYIAATPSVFGLEARFARIQGLKIKPTNRGDDICALEPIERTDEVINSWARWLYDAVETFEKYKDNWENAPRYTHSCNRYFRPCSLVPFCADTAAGRKEQFRDMIPADLSPSERAVLEA